MFFPFPTPWITNPVSLVEVYLHDFVFVSTCIIEYNERVFRFKAAENLHDTNTGTSEACRFVLGLDLKIVTVCKHVAKERDELDVETRACTNDQQADKRESRNAVREGESWISVGGEGGRIAVKKREQIAEKEREGNREGKRSQKQTLWDGSPIRKLQRRQL